MAYYAETASAKGADGNLMVRFYKKLIQKKYAVNQKHPGLAEKDFKWENVEKDYVEIKVPGNRLDFYDGPATDLHKKRFSHQWDLYTNRMEQAPKGIPLEQCAALNQSDVRMLETNGFVTVEQVVNMSDTQSQKFHAGRAIQKRVSDWYDTYVDQAASGKVTELEEKIAALEAKLTATPEVAPEATEEMIKRLIAENAVPKNKGGRPKGSKNHGQKPNQAQA